MPATRWPSDCTQNDCELYSAQWEMVAADKVRITVRAKQAREKWLAIGFSETPTMVCSFPVCTELLIHSPTLTVTPLKFWEMTECFHPTVYDGCNYLSMLGLKLTHVNEGALGYKVTVLLKCERACIVDITRGHVQFLHIIVITFWLTMYCSLCWKCFFNTQENVDVIYSYVDGSGTGHAHDA